MNATVRQPGGIQHAPENAVHVISVSGKPYGIGKDIAASLARIAALPCTACLEALLELKTALLLHQRTQRGRQWDDSLARVGLRGLIRADVAILLQVFDRRMGALNVQAILLHVPPLEAAQL